MCSIKKIIQNEKYIEEDYVNSYFQDKYNRY